MEYKAYVHTMCRYDIMVLVHRFSTRGILAQFLDMRFSSTSAIYIFISLICIIRFEREQLHMLAIWKILFYLEDGYVFRKFFVSFFSEKRGSRVDLCFHVIFFHRPQFSTGAYALPERRRQ